MSTLESMLADANLATAPTFPKGHGTYSYFTAQCALRVKNILDDMRADPSTHRHISSAKMRMKPKTLLSWYKQGLGFLLQNADPTKLYANTWPKIVAKAQKDGMLLMWLHLVAHDPNFVRSSVMTVNRDVTSLYVWRDRLQSFLEEGLPGECLSLTSISLTADEVELLRHQLRMVPDITYEIESTKLVVTRRRDVPEQPKSNVGLVVDDHEVWRNNEV